MRPPDRRVSSIIQRLPGGRRTAGPLALLLAVLGLVALVLLSRSGGPGRLATPAESTRFYIEATIVVLGPAGANGVRPESAKSTVQWWYVRPGVWRWQINVDSAADDPKTFLGVADGKDSWFYQSDQNAYTRVSVKTNPSPALPTSVYLGPLDVNQIVQEWEASDVTVRSGGAYQFMGRSAQVLEYSPTWHSSGAGGDLSGGIGRIWIDDDTGLILRNLVDGGSANEYIDARVTLLELDPHFDVNTFNFDIPAGATQVKPDSGGSSIKTP